MIVMSRPAIASPRTNLLAPSMAPKKLLSPSSSLRRARASFSSMRPADRSASIAICLPGMASRVKRALTSAMRPEPLVITTKFTITRIAKTMMPMTKLPCIIRLPNASMTWPAASVPLWPSPRIRREEAILSARRSIVAMTRMVGKALNSSGLRMNSTVMRIRTEKVNERPSEASSRKVGSGTSRTARIARMPNGSSSSPPRSDDRTDAAAMLPPLRAGGDVFTSLI